MEDQFLETLSSHQTFYLNTWHFLILAVAAILAMRVLPVGNPRAWLLAIFNIYFVSYFVADLASAIALVVILVVSFLLGKLRLYWSDSSPTWFFALIVFSLWIILFFIKDPELFPWVNPFHYQPIQIIGISYLMFRSINYVVDIEILEKHDFISFCNYMIFFPALLAGPIARFDEFHETQNIGAADDVMPYLHRIANGCIKKFVIADNLAAIGIFAHPEYGELSVVMLWIAVLMQLFIFYMDFSGYTDIVIGIAGLMGFHLPENFNRPFKAVNLQEFWLRWHMSMTSFIRDYIFTPLSRAFVYKMDRKWHFPLFLFLSAFTMMVIALWHATTLGFLVFGISHGLVLIGLQLKHKFLPHFFSGEDVFTIWSSRALTYIYISITVSLWYHGVHGTAGIVSKMFGF